MVVTKKVNLELSALTPTPEIRVGQGDENSRQAVFALLSEGAPWPVPEGTVATVRYSKPDGTVGVYNTLPDGTPAVSYGGNELTVLLAPQLLAVAGVVLCQAVLYQGQAVLATFDFSVIVVKSTVWGLESEDYFRIADLDTLKAALEEAKKSESDAAEAKAAALAAESARALAQSAEEAAAAAAAAAAQDRKTAESAATRAEANGSVATQNAARAITSASQAKASAQAAQEAAGSVVQVTQDAAAAAVKAEDAAQRADAVIQLMESSQVKRYGARRALNASSPRLERFWNAQGLTAAAGVDGERPQNDFDHIYPWSQMRVCNLRDVGGELLVTAYEGDPGFARDGSNGEVAVEIPKFYQPPRRPGDGYEYWGVSDLPIGGWALNPRFLTAQGAELDRIYIAAYEGCCLAADEVRSGAGGKQFTLSAGMHSISGAVPAVSIGRTAFRSSAAQAGQTYGLFDLAGHDVVTTLFAVEFATLDCQSVMRGCADGITSLMPTGGTDQVAASSGSPVSLTDGVHACKYRGLENLWGHIWEWLDGVNIQDCRAWVHTDPAQYGDNVFAAPYKELGYLNAGANGFVREMGFDERYPWARLPVDTTGSDKTYFGDYYFQTTGLRALRVGGDGENGSLAGMWYFSGGAAPTTVSADAGARLSWKP